MRQQASHAPEHHRRDLVRGGHPVQPTKARCDRVGVRSEQRLVDAARTAGDADDALEQQQRVALESLRLRYERVTL